MMARGEAVDVVSGPSYDHGLDGPDGDREGLAAMGVGRAGPGIRLGTGGTLPYPTPYLPATGPYRREGATDGRGQPPMT